MRKISRRAFARDVMLLAAAAAVMPSVIAQTSEKPAALSAASQAEVDARVQWIVAKYGSRLNDEQRADIRRVITGGQAGVEAMRKYDLQNATGPAEPFRIYRRVAKR